MTNKKYNNIADVSTSNLYKMLDNVRYQGNNVVGWDTTGINVTSLTIQENVDGYEIK